MKKVSIAKKNAFILIMTLLPFIIGILFSLYKSSDMEEFGVAINISGSQRMRTMLIANVVQNIEDFYNEGNVEALDKSLDLLNSELVIYELYMDALINGNSELALSPNKYPKVQAKIRNFQILYKNYVMNAKAYSNDLTLSNNVDYIVSNALELKNSIHLVVEEYQKEYDIEVTNQRNLNAIILIVSIVLTLLGLNLTKRLRENEFDATYDFLTGLKTRKVMFKEANKRNIKNLNLFFIDLDKFKEINDTYGHNIGDEILKEASQRFIDKFNYDDVYRYAGDEFIIIKECKSNESKEEVCTNVSKAVNELKAAFNKPFIDSNNVYHHLGFSCGVVTKSAGIDNVYDLVNLADDLMYDSKNFASQVIICDSKESATNRMNLKAKAKDAIKNNEIVPYLQPIYNIYKDELIGFEILARWELNGVTYTPMEFLPIFKRNGLLESLDNLMIKNIEIVYKSLSQRLGKPYDKSLHINLSNSTLLNPDSDRLVLLMENIHVPIEQVVFELNEKVTDIKRLNRNLKKLKKIGCYFTLNDYSKDNVLFELLNHDYISHMRIDQEVVAMIEDDNYEFISEMVNYANSKSKDCIGEGVETLKQFNILRSCGVSNFQGFLFYKAISLYDIDQIIKTIFNKVDWRKFS